MLACPSDKFTLVPGQTACQTCPNGYICKNHAPQRCSEAAGNLNAYCVGGIIAECREGTLSTHPAASSADFCRPCLAGLRCNFAGRKVTSLALAHSLSDPFLVGFYGWAGGPQQIIPQGHFADPGSYAYAFSCPAGTANFLTKQVGL